MAIRTWWYEGLSHTRWDDDEGMFVKPVGLKHLYKYPEDYHFFIVTTDQQRRFEGEVRLFKLHIHYKQSKPSVSYRYPADGPKLWAYVLTVNRSK